MNENCVRWYDPYMEYAPIYTTEVKERPDGEAVKPNPTPGDGPILV